MPFVYFAVIAIALLLAASVLLKKKSKPLGEDTPSTLSERGGFVNTVIGTREVGYFFGWRGDRKTKRQSTGGKGGFFGGGQKTTVIFEAGWHIPTIGPVRQLWAIVQGGKTIWTGPINSTDTPSGSTVTLANGEGTFMIHWGEIDQPVNTFMGDRLTRRIYSRWPFCMQITWIEKALGSASTWPEIKYVVTADCLGSGLVDSSMQLDDGTSRGMNPAHVTEMVTTSPHPHGRGVPTSLVDNDTLESLGVLAQTEHLPMNYVIEGGPVAADFLSSIMLDMGVQVPQVKGRLTFIPIREPTGDLPVLDDDVVVAPDLNLDIDRGEQQITGLIFTFKNEDNWAFNTVDIPINDDAEASEVGAPSPQNIGIEIATHVAVASQIARRRSQEPYLKATQTLSVLRGARLLMPGQAFLRAARRFFVASVKRADDSAMATIECVPDLYAVPDTGDLSSAGGGGTTHLPVSPDIAFRLLQTLTPAGQIAVVVLRIRKHNLIVGAGFYISATDDTYTQIGNQDTPAAGGLLLTDLPDTGAGAGSGSPLTLEDGPLFEAANSDVASILDLTSDPASHEAGRQIAVLNDEVIYLRNIEAQSESDWAASTAYTYGDSVIPTGAPTGFRYVSQSAGTSGSSEPSWPSGTANYGQTVIDGTVLWQARYFAYAMKGLIREREGTVAGYHSQDDQAYIADRNTLNLFTNVIIYSSADLYGKTQPFTSSAAVDLADVDSEYLFIS